MLTWLEISKKAIEYNIKQYKKLVGKNVILMPVIKSNAYGHGFYEVAKIVNSNMNIDRIAVVSSDEALSLVNYYNNNDKLKPIQILSFYELDSKKLLILAQNNVIFPLYTLEQAKFLNRIGENAKKKIKVHIKIDIGTSRIGVLPNDVLEFVNKIKKYKFIEIEGFFGHFATTEENEGLFTEQQLKLFNEIVTEIEQTGLKIKYKHTTCSAAAILYKQSYFNMVRFGISLYGLHPSEKTINKISLMPALSWHTKTIQVKEVPAGTKVGYGCTFITKKKTKIATLPIGYWDGYDRGFSNNAFVLVKGHKCPVVGRISMNLTTVDVSEVKEISVGDKITLIGKQGKTYISAEDLASWINTINYEIVDRINPLLPRAVRD